MFAPGVRVKPLGAASVRRDQRQPSVTIAPTFPHGGLGGPVPVISPTRQRIELGWSEFVESEFEVGPGVGLHWIRVLRSATGPIARSRVSGARSGLGYFRQPSIGRRAREKQSSPNGLFNEC
jgi:hypothetical protein